jgi:hypothetical protein
MSFYTVVDKYLWGYLDFGSIFFWNAIGMFCGVLALLCVGNLRREFVGAVVSIGKKGILVHFVEE